MDRRRPRTGVLGAKRNPERAMMPKAKFVRELDDEMARELLKPLPEDYPDLDYLLDLETGDAPHPNTRSNSSE